MLEDRDYMRRRPTHRIAWSATLVLIVINVVVFVAQNVVDFPNHLQFVNDWFALSLDGLEHGRVWQLITFQFLHANFFHILGNMITIYFLGHAVEEAVGRANFIKLYLASGVLGGLVQVGASLAWEAHFGTGGVVGASAGGFGLLAAFAVLFPNRPLYFFFLPIEIRARHLLWLGLAASLIGMAWPSSPGGMAHGAHLGGMLTGLCCIRWLTRAHKPLMAWQPHASRSLRRELVTARSQKPPLGQRPRPALPVDLPPAEFITREVDPILDKISAHGIQSLTERERQILEAARAKMSKR